MPRIYADYLIYVFFTVIFPYLYFKLGAECALDTSIGQRFNLYYCGNGTSEGMDMYRVYWWILIITVLWKSVFWLFLPVFSYRKAPKQRSSVQVMTETEKTNKEPKFIRHSYRPYHRMKGLCGWFEKICMVLQFSLLSASTTFAAFMTVVIYWSSGDTGESCTLTGISNDVTTSIVTNASTTSSTVEYGLFYPCDPEPYLDKASRCANFQSFMPITCGSLKIVAALLSLSSVISGLIITGAMIGWAVLGLKNDYDTEVKTDSTMQGTLGAEIELFCNRLRHRLVPALKNTLFDPNGSTIVDASADSETGDDTPDQDYDLNIPKRKDGKLSATSRKRSKGYIAVLKAMRVCCTLDMAKVDDTDTDANRKGCCPVRKNKGSRRENCCEGPCVCPTYFAPATIKKQLKIASHTLLRYVYTFLLVWLSTHITAQFLCWFSLDPAAQSVSLHPAQDRVELQWFLIVIYFSLYVRTPSLPRPFSICLTYPSK